MDIVSYLLGKNAGGGGGGGPLQELDVTPTDQEQVLLPEEGYAGFSQVTVAAIQPPVVPPEAGTLTGIVVGTLPKVSYVEGDPLDLTGCVILANYSNGYQYDVTAYCTFTCNDPVTFSDTGIVVTFETQTLTIPITVAGAPVEAPAETKGLWHFDDGTDKNEVNGKGTTSSGLVDPANISSTAGKFGSGCSPTSFAYPNRYFNYNNSLQLANYNQINDAILTLETWFFMSSGSTRRIAFAFCNTDGSSDGTISIYTTNNTGTLNFSISTAFWPSQSSVSKTIDFAKWHHLAIVFNHTTKKIFIDGEIFVTSTGAATSNNVGFKYINCTSNSGTIYMDEVLITESAKYVTDFEPPHAPYYLASQGGE